MPPKPTLEELYERKKEVSGQVSAQTRTSALGLLAISWALLTAHDPPLRSLVEKVDRRFLLAIAVSAVAVIAMDLLQYVAATTATDAALKEARTADPPEANYNDDSFSYRAIGWMYRGKFVALAVGAVVLFGVFIRMFCAR